MTDAQRAARIVAEERSDVVDLATVCSLAVRIEPPLLRAMRVRFVPGADASAEADLWFGPFVQFRSLQGVVLDPSVAEVLRARLVRRGARLDEAFEEVRRHHARLPFLARMEEELAWLVCKAAGDAALDAPLQRVLATMLRDDRRTEDLAAWFLRALPRMPERVRSSGLTWALALAAGARLRVTPDLSGEAPGGVARLLPPEMLPGPEHDVEVSIERKGGDLLFGAPGSGSMRLRLPATSPLLLEISAGGEVWGAAFQRGETKRVPVSGGRVVLRTLRGDKYEIRPAARARKAPSKRATVEAKVSIARLPVTGADLYGREDDLAWLDTCWETRRPSVLVLVGSGGVGKSALVNAWLKRMQEDGFRGAERVYGWSFYSQGTDDRVASADLFLHEALAWFGDPDPATGSPWDRGARLATLVRRGRTLLILDGVEPLQETREGRGYLQDTALQALIRGLATGPTESLCILTTRLRVLGVDDDGILQRDLNSLSPDAGARLLRKRGVRGTEDQLRKATREYGGHALALTLLGSYLRAAHKGDIRKRHEIGSIAEDRRHGAHARRIMAAYERWLTEPELVLLSILGLFDRPASEGEIQAVLALPEIPGFTDVPLDESTLKTARGRLQELGLVAEDRDSDGGMALDTHPLVREHFAERLRTASPEAWREGHGRLFELLRSLATDLPETILDLSPLYAAVVHGCRAGMYREALHELYERRIHRGRERYAWTQVGAFGAEVAALSAFFDPPWEHVALDEPDRSYLLRSASFALRATGRLSDAQRLLAAAEADPDDELRIGDPTSDLSELLMARGELQRATALALERVERAKHDKGSVFYDLVHALTTLASVRHQLGRDHEALALFEEAEAAQARLVPFERRLLALPGFLYCDVLIDQRRYDEARTRALELLEWADKRGRLFEEGLGHLAASRAEYLSSAPAREIAFESQRQEDPSPGAAHLDRAVECLRRSGRQDFLPLGLLARAERAIATAALDAARRDLDEASSLAARNGHRLQQTDVHLGFARLHVAAGEPAKAGERLAEARSGVDATGYHRRDAEITALDAVLDSREDRRPANVVVEQAPASMDGKQIEQFVDALVSAFPTRQALASMLRFGLDRKLEELVPPGNIRIIGPDLVSAFLAEGRAMHLLGAARESAPSNPALLRFAQPYGLAAVPVVGPEARPLDGPALDRIVGRTPHDMTSWLSELGRIQEQVCLVVVGGALRGTGFLVGSDLVFTCYHNIAGAMEDKLDPSSISLRFGFKRTVDGVTTNPGVHYRLAPDWLIDASPPGELDYALLRVDGQPGDDPVGGKEEPGALHRGWVSTSRLGALDRGSAVAIVHYASGESLKLTMEASSLGDVNENRTRVEHMTSTYPGSSGAPCFNADWELLALHHRKHSAVPQRNEAVPFEAILDRLTRNRVRHLLGP